MFTLRKIPNVNKCINLAQFRQISVHPSTQVRHYSDIAVSILFYTFAYGLRWLMLTLFNLYIYNYETR